MIDHRQIETPSESALREEIARIHNSWYLDPIKKNDVKIISLVPGTWNGQFIIAFARYEEISTGWVGTCGINAANRDYVKSWVKED